MAVQQILLYQLGRPALWLMAGVDAGPVAGGGVGELVMAVTNKKHLEFINNYFLLRFNATDAYEATYPKATRESARRLGSQLLVRTDIQEEIQLRTNETASKVEDAILKASILDLPISARKSKPDKVYFIRSENGLVKIGIASDVYSRLGNLNTASPIELELLFWIQCDNARRTEVSLHNIFESKRVKGEWFKLTDEDLIWVRNNYGVE